MHAKTYIDNIITNYLVVNDGKVLGQVIGMSDNMRFFCLLMTPSLVVVQEEGISLIYLAEF